MRLKRNIMIALVAITAIILGACSGLTESLFEIETQGSFRIMNESFSLGSLIASGDVTGLGKTDVTMELLASGIPEVICRNQGGNTAPGVNKVKVLAKGQQLLNSEDYTKNGRSPFRVSSGEPPRIDPLEAGCPNANWSAEIVFVFWTDAIISVSDTATGTPLGQQEYACTTTKTDVTCKRK